MKNTLFAITASTLLLLSGCSQKTPEIDTAETTPVETTEVVVTDNTSGVDKTQESMETTLKRLQGEINTIYFNFDQFGIRTDMRDVISNNANLLNNSAKSFNARLEGNCDEWGTDEYNMALGLKRAKSVKDALRAKGVDVSRMSVVTFGENNPTCTQKIKACWSQNRRVDVKLLPAQ